MKKISEEFLAKEVWWWRPDATHRPPEFNPKNSLAFNYELVRRVYRSECLAPFYALKVRHFSVIWPLSDDPLQQPVSRNAYTPDKQKESGWTAPNPTLQWNLNASNRALQATFKLFIRQERSSQNISEPRPNAGIRRKPVSWLWLELMDLADLKVRKLDDNERGKLSAARKVANIKANDFATLIDEYFATGLATEHYFNGFDDDEPDYDNLVIYFDPNEKPFGKGYWLRE